ncbi:MAG: hypothetical protein K9J21_11900 [Bacteroidales bacterium]|nr:hypothetical protein [Bacteroidales bacterium]
MAKENKAEDITFNRIREWLNDPNPQNLSDKDREIYERWDFAYDQLKYERPAAVVNRIKKKFGVHENTARSDVKNAQRLFNPTLRIEAEWLEKYIIDDAKLQIQAAREAADFKAWNSARNSLIKMYELLKDKQAKIDPNQLGNNQYVLAVNFGDTYQKIDVNKLFSLQNDDKGRITELLYKPIENTDEAENIMKS